jgi:hypothetical protein
MQTLPRDIHKGMRVFDSARNEIGKIDDFKFSENEDQPGVEPEDLDAADRPQDGGLMQDIAEAFVPDGMPEVLRDRLLREGYIRLDSKGLFAADRYILPDQIASASGDEVTLNVGKDELIKRH